MDDRTPSWNDPAAIDKAVGILGERARLDAPLGAITTSRVGGLAAIAYTANTAADLCLVGEASHAAGMAVLIVGRGSNLLVADQGFEGIAVFLGASFSRIDIDQRAATAIVGAAVALPVLARRCAEAGVGGLEWAVGVPGSVGGAIKMNAGGHGSDIASCLIDATIIDLSSDAGPSAPVTYEPHALDLRYRHSGLSDAQVVTRARLQGRTDDPSTALGRIAEIVRWRREHQPGGQNAGSVFMNPPQDSAGARIDQAGLRGLRIGTAEVSRIHANFIVSDPGGTAADVAALMAEVRRRVADSAGIALQPEVRMVGFESADASGSV